MQRLHVHEPVWIHTHKPDWHLFGTRLEHLIHGSRFWAAVALVVLLGVMFVLAVLSRSGMITDAPIAPLYPYPPYLP